MSQKYKLLHVQILYSSWFMVRLMTGTTVSLLSCPNFLKSRRTKKYTPGSGEGEPGQGYDGDTYSWIAYASKQGYPTLSIDRLGSGISTRPDPITTVQDPLQAEIHYQLIALIRANKAKLPRAFNKIIYVGHSFGSLIGHLMNVNHPNAVEASLLTGFSKTLINELPGLVTSFNLLPADTVLSQFSNLRVGYLTPDNEQGAIWTFFQGSYDPAFAEYVYSIRQTITIGEILSALPIAQATAHTNPVFVISGELDNIFCNPTGTQLTVASCGGAGGILDQTRTVYPLADLQGNYYWEGLADMGHCWQQHSNAIQGYADSHNWMAARGF